MNADQTSGVQSCAYSEQTYPTIKVPTGIDINGLNLCDQEHISRVGFGAWFNEACDAQQERLAVRQRSRYLSRLQYEEVFFEKPVKSAGESLPPNVRAARPAQNAARIVASEEQSDCPNKLIFVRAESIAYKAHLTLWFGQVIPDLIGTFFRPPASKSRTVGCCMS